MIIFARDGIFERDGVGRGRATSKGTAGSASGDIRVGDVGNGGTSSIENDIGGRWELKDARERENDARRDARDDFLLNDFICLFFSLSSVSLSLAESYSTSSPI